MNTDRINNGDLSEAIYVHIERWLIKMNLQHLVKTKAHLKLAQDLTETFISR